MLYANLSWIIYKSLFTYLLYEVLNFNNPSNQLNNGIQ